MLPQTLPCTTYVTLSKFLCMWPLVHPPPSSHAEDESQSKNKAQERRQTVWGWVRPFVVSL